MPMLMELRVALRAHSSRPAAVVEGPIPEPLGPEIEAPLDRLAHERLWWRLGMKPPPDVTGSEDR